MRRDWVRWLIGVALVSLTFGAVADTDADVERACGNLVLDYAYHRDRMDGAALANLFTEAGVLSVLGETYQGRSAIRARLENDREAPLSRHLMSTQRIFVDGPDRARGVSYATVYLAPRGELPRPVEGFAGIGEYHDEFVRTPDGWKIGKREFVPVFVYQRD